MTIKLDTDTNISKNGLLVIGKKVNVTAQRGSDAYLHAVTISSDSTYGASIGSVVAMSETTGKTSADIKVEGTVKKETTNAVLQLSTSGGDMTIRIDANTKWTDSTAVKTGEKVTAVVYRGEDKYMHAASVTSKLDTPPATTLNGASQVAFTGTLRKVDGYTLTVKTAEGDQIFRFDNSSDFKEYRLLQEDRTVTVIGVVGADGYWHVKSISG